MVDTERYMRDIHLGREFRHAHSSTGGRWTSNSIIGAIRAEAGLKTKALSPCERFPCIERSTLRYATRYGKVSSA